MTPEASALRNVFALLTRDSQPLCMNTAAPFGSRPYLRSQARRSSGVTWASCSLAARSWMWMMASGAISVDAAICSTVFAPSPKCAGASMCVPTCSKYERVLE